MNFMNGWRLSSLLPFFKSAVSFSFLSLSFHVWRNELCMTLYDFVGIHEVGLMEDRQWLRRRDYCLGHLKRLYRDDIILRT